MATEVERLEALLSQQEETIAAAFREFIREVNSKAVVREIVEKLEAGDVGGALAIVDSYAVRFANVLPAVHAAFGAAEAEALRQLAGQFAIAITFDPSHPRAAQLVRANRLQWIVEFTSEQREATRQAISRAFETGAGTADMARAFRGSIGLTREHERWVASYERALRNLDARAMTRALRDGRFDRTTERAIELKKPLTEAQIQARVERYRARTLAMRGDNIARTEALTATSQAREEAARQMVEQLGIKEFDVERTWHRTDDKRVRDWHDSMEGQTRPMGVPFEDGNGELLMYPGDPDASARTRINCRCTHVFTIKPGAMR